MTDTCDDTGENYLRRMRAIMRSVYLLLGLLIATGCGSKDKSDKRQTAVAPDKSKVAEGQEKDTEGDTLPPTGESELPPTGREISVPAAPFVERSLQELTGVYEQIENREVKLRIDQSYLALTNIQLSVPTQDGSVLITPRFPHHLQQAPQQISYSTAGYYNIGDDLWKHVELRIVPQQGTNAIDVTFVISVAKESASSPEGEDATATVFDACFYDICNPCSDCSICDPLYPCQPVNPCPACPEPEDNTEERRLLYRFEKVEVAPPEAPTEGAPED